MPMRHLGRFRALALGFFSAAALVASARAGDGPAATETVQILDAARSGDLAVTVRGAGDDHVAFRLINKSARRLNVVIPPGLVAAASTGQPGGGGFQSMGLGVPTTNPGSFGAFRSPGSSGEGFRSVAAAPALIEGIGVSPGQTIHLSVPSVCLNFGVATPMAKNVFTLQTVEDFTRDARVRKALKSLSTLGTSQGVAQATMWNVCNGMTFEQIAGQSVKTINPAELAQAARFVEALDASTTDLVEPSYFQQGRLLVHLSGDATVEKEVVRLNGDLGSVRMMGLPVSTIETEADLVARPGTVFIDARLSSKKPGSTAVRVVVRGVTAFGEWKSFGQLDARISESSTGLTAEAFADDLGKAIARNFVSATVVRRTPGSTTVRVANHLPMTISDLTLKAGKAGDVVGFEAVGIGPMRNATVTIPAASAVVDGVILNGL